MENIDFNKFMSLSDDNKRTTLQNMGYESAKSFLEAKIKPKNKQVYIKYMGALKSKQNIEVKAYNNQNDEELKRLSIDEIFNNPYQPRKDIENSDLEEFADEIEATNGLLEPILVAFMDNKYIIVAGERRLRAYRILHLREKNKNISEYNYQYSTIPVYIRKDIKKDSDLRVMSLAENNARVNPSHIDTAVAIKELREIDEFSQLNIKEFSNLIGKSASETQKYLTLASLNNEIIEYARSINFNNKTALYQLATPKFANKTIDELKQAIKCVQDGIISTRDLENGTINKSETLNLSTNENSQVSTNQSNKKIKYNHTDLFDPHIDALRYETIINDFKNVVNAIQIDEPSSLVDNFAIIEELTKEIKRYAKHLSKVVKK